MKILITGATGFIGKHLIKELKKDKSNKIRVLVRKTSNTNDLDFLKDLDVELVYGDILADSSLLKATKDIDTVFHLAGGGNVAATFKSGYKELFELNVLSTEKVIQASIKNKVKAFVHFSSISAMGIIVERTITEKSMSFPKTPHEVCKLESEKICEQYKDKLLITIIRPGIVFGPYAKNSEILQLARLLKKHIFVIPGNGRNVMPWVYIKSVIDGTLLAYKKNTISCEKFIIVSDKEPTFNELIDSIKQSLKVKVIIIHFPKSLFRLGGLILEKLGNILKIAPPINTVRAKSMTSNRIYSIEKIKRLGFNENIDFNEGIKQTIEWYKLNGYI